jgi:AcrR family transcriptional regulator
MKAAERTPVTTALGAPASSLDSLTNIEKTQTRLWALALLLFLLVSLSLLILDTASSLAERFILDVTTRAHDLLDHYGASAALLAIVMLICAYFVEKLVMVRNRNRGLVRALDASARILALRNDQLDTWDQLSHQLITNFNLPRLLELIARTAADVTESDCAAVILSERDSPHLRLAAVHRRGLHTELARRVAAKVIAAGEPIHLRLGALPEEFDRPDLPLEGLVSLAATPLVAADAIEGSLLVGRLQPAEPFPDNIVHVLRSFGNQASIALEKAHLYAENQKQLQRLGRLLEELRSAQDRLTVSQRAGEPAEVLAAGKASADEGQPGSA